MITHHGGGWSMESQTAFGEDSSLSMVGGGWKCGGHPLPVCAVVVVSSGSYQGSQARGSTLVRVAPAHHLDFTSACGCRATLATSYHPGWRLGSRTQWS